MDVVGVEAEAGSDLLSWFHFLLGGKPHFQVKQLPGPLAVRRAVLAHTVGRSDEIRSRLGRKTCTSSMIFPPFEVNLDMTC